MTTRDVALVGIEGREDHGSVLKLCRVVNYCASLLPFSWSVLLSYLYPPPSFGGYWNQIPVLDRSGFNVFDTRCLHHFVRSPFVLTLHCDGFILNPEHWQDEFLNYDFVGAPWEFGTGRSGSAPSVGNGGFCLRSLEFMRACDKLPWHNRIVNGDAFYCLHHRKTLEKAGMKFAPPSLAAQFSCETGAPGEKLFGFHGNEALKNQAWEKLFAFEKGLKLPASGQLMPPLPTAIGGQA